MPLSDRRRALPDGHFGGSGEQNTNIQYGERPTRPLGHSQLRASQSTIHTKYCIESSSALPDLSHDLDWTEQLSEYRNFHSKKRKRKCPVVPGEVSQDCSTATMPENTNSTNKTNNAAPNDIGDIDDIDDIETIGRHLNLERQYSNSTTDTILTNDDQTDTISTLSQPDIEMTCESGNILLTENELRLFDVNEHQSVNTNTNTNGETNEIDDINEDDERWETEIEENETDWFIDIPDCQSDDIDLVTSKQNNNNNNNSITTGHDINVIDTNDTNNATDKNHNNNNNNTNNNNNNNNHNGGNSINENGITNSASDTDNSSFADNSPLANIIRTRFQRNTNQFRQTRLQFRRTPNRTMMLDINNDNSGNDLVDIDNSTNMTNNIQNNNNNNAINNDTNTNTSINNSNNNTNSSRNNNNNSNNNLIWDSESTRVRLDRDKTEVLSTLYNYMKISEMDRYGIEIFDKGLRSVLDELTESDFQSLATSYWCNGIHFECMIKYRGTKISNNEKLQLPISSTLMDQAVTGGASVNKIKSLLLQKRKDTKNLKLSLKQELEFFRRNCHIRFWNHEVLVRSFLENGWLTPEIAQIGLNKFLLHIFDRAVRNRSQKKQSKKPSKNKHNKNNTNGDVRNTCNGVNNTHNLNRKTPSSSSSSSYKCPALQYGNVSFDIDMNASSGGTGSNSNNSNNNFNNNYYSNKNKNKRRRRRNNRNGKNGRSGTGNSNGNKHNGQTGQNGQNDATVLFGYPSEDDRDTILNRDGNTRDLDPINFSEKTLHRWCCLIEILCSRGAKCPKAKFKGVPQLAHSATSGKNTWWIISTPVGMLTICFFLLSLLID